MMNTITFNTKDKFKKVNVIIMNSTGIETMIKLVIIENGLSLYGGNSIPTNVNKKIAIVIDISGYIISN